MRMPLLCLLCLPFFVFSSTTEFIESFVKYYDISSEGRYTHEYHPYLLERTKESFKELESMLQASGFLCSGRIVIMGYQKDGVASYYSNQHTESLKDEASLSSQRGRIVPAHNIFGFLTGFLLKDVEWLQTAWYPESPFFIEHIFSDQVELFDDAAFIFQKHAFGKDFEAILNYRKRVEKSIKTRSFKSLFKELISFWDCAYHGELKSCAKETLATQDILFSIDYAQHILTSTIPVNYLYVGPDITYPIEELSFQKQEVTASAQEFVKKITRAMCPVKSGEKTVYIFCSFVDGVGKSTLLGNVINWVTHGTAIERYKRVDNSSSQKGVLYPLTPDVYILDLPAQLSHWISKPDGVVFVDACSITEARADLSTLKAYVHNNAADLKQRFEEERAVYRTTKKISDDLFGIYVENVEKGAIKEPWIPFSCGSWRGIFDVNNEEDLRLLVPFEGVHSKGLKGAQPEQMLFTKGLLIPLKFEMFMKDIVDQLEKAEIKQIVFVDFLSMYPRSSRENIRVNFLLQQMKGIYGDHFDIEKSMYRSFVDQDIELCHLLLMHKEAFINTLMMEAITRASLYKACTEKMSDTLTVASQQTVSEYLVEQNEMILKNQGKDIYNLVSEKIMEDTEKLKKHFFNGKYEIFFRFSCKPLYAFSDFLERLFGHDIENQYFQKIWEGMNISLEHMKEGEKQLQVSSEIDLSVLECIPEVCKDSVTLTPLLKVLRGQWFMLLSNLLDCHEKRNGIFYIEKPTAYVVPLLVKRGACGKAFFVQKHLPEYEAVVPYSVKQSLFRFNNTLLDEPQKWVDFDGIPHRIGWDAVSTHYGVYTCGYDWDRPEAIRMVIRSLIEKKRKDGFEDPVIFSSELLQALIDQKILNRKDALVAGSKQIKKISVDSEQGQAIALWVRAIATLEMIVKDPLSVVITRKGNQIDFAATLQLIEHVMLLRYFGIQFDKPLFQNYFFVKPVISWECLID